VTDPAREPITWREAGRPEQTLIGVQYTADNASLPTQPLHVGDTTHWAYAGSGLSSGMTLTRMVGYEVDRLFATYTQPLSTTYAVLATSPFTASTGPADVSQAGIYQAPKRAWRTDGGSLPSSAISSATRAKAYTAAMCGRITAGNRREATGKFS